MSDLTTPPSDCHAAPEDSAGRLITPFALPLPSPPLPGAPRAPVADAASFRGFGDRYAVAGEISRGGMGIILDARDAKIRRELAIKVLLSGREATEEEIARFIEEAQIQGQLEHPNICPVHELNVDAEGRHYFTMKKVRGRSLAQILREERSRKPAAVPDASRFRLLEIFRKVCDAVAFAHAHGVVHRDLKPDNVMVGEFGEVMVMDWGIAKILGRREAPGSVEGPVAPSPVEGPGSPAASPVVSDRAGAEALLSLPGTIHGTPSYMSPEQARGEVDRVDERSDIYALGGILYAMLTLEDPVRGDTVAHILEKVTRRQLVPPSRRAPARRIPPDLEAAVLKAMAARPEDRYANVAALQADVTAFLEGRTLAAASYGPLEVAVKWIRRNRALAATGAAAVAILIPVAVFYVVDVTRARGAAEREAARALAAEGEANRKAEAARAAEAESLRALSESRLFEGDALAPAGRWPDAVARYDEARRMLERLKRDITPAELGLWDAFRRQAPPLHVFRGHAGAVTCSAFSPDGRRALTGSDDGTVRIWNLDAGAPAGVLRGHAGAVWSAAYSPDGRSLVTGGDDKTLRVWAAAGGDPRTLWTHTFPVTAVAFTPDGARILAGAMNGSLKLLDAASGKVLRTLRGPTATVWSVAVSPDGSTALSCGSDRAVRVWDLPAGTERKVYGGYPDNLQSVAFSPDGRRALTGGVNGVLQVLDLEGEAEPRDLPGHSGRIWSVAFFPDGATAVTGGDDRTVRIWDLAAGKERRILSGHSGGVRSVAVSADGRRILSAGEDRTAALWEPGAEGEVLPFAGSPGGVRTAAFSPDGRLALTGTDGHDLKLWDAATGLPIKTLSGHGGLVRNVAFFPDGANVLSAAEDGTARIWDLATGREVKSFANRKPLWCAAISPDARLLLTGGVEMPAALWEAETGRKLRDLPGHSGTVRAVAFSPDGLRILTAGDFGVAKIWETGTGRELLNLTGHPGAMTCAGFSPDGRRVVAAGDHGVVKVWDAGTGREALALAGHGGIVRSAGYSSDGRRILTCGVDRTVRIWDAVEGRLLRTFDGFTDAVRCAVFDPEGKRILLAADRLELWDLGRPALHRTFESRFGAVRGRIGAMADPDLPSVCREWLAFRGSPARAVALSEAARAAGAPVPALGLARAYWKTGDRASAHREFQTARDRKEAPDLYLALCLEATAP